MGSLKETWRTVFRPKIFRDVVDIDCPKCGERARLEMAFVEDPNSVPLVDVENPFAPYIWTMRCEKCDFHRSGEYMTLEKIGSGFLLILSILLPVYVAVNVLQSFPGVVGFVGMWMALAAGIAIGLRLRLSYLIKMALKQSRHKVTAH